MLFIKAHFPDLNPIPPRGAFVPLYTQLFLYYIHRHRSILSLAYQCTELDKLHLPASQMLQIERMEGEKKKMRKLENKMPTLGN